MYVGDVLSNEGDSQRSRLNMGSVGACNGVSSSASSMADITNMTSSREEVLDSKIYLVDLAGSERNSRSLAEGTRLDEL